MLWQAVHGDEETAGVALGLTVICYLFVISGSSTSSGGAASSQCGLWFNTACYLLGGDRLPGENGTSPAHYVLTSDKAQLSRYTVLPDGWARRSQREVVVKRVLVVMLVPLVLPYDQAATCLCTMYFPFCNYVFILFILFWHNF